MLLFEVLKLREEEENKSKRGSFCIYTILVAFGISRLC
jgi:hypothetical protein